jgi:hypothetical protein
MTVTIRRFKKCTTKRKCGLKYGPFDYAATVAIIRSNFPGKTLQGLFCRVTT